LDLDKFPVLVVDTKSLVATFWLSFYVHRSIRCRLYKPGPIRLGILDFEFQRFHQVKGAVGGEA
jgi:hypothetical protein